MLYLGETQMKKTAFLKPTQKSRSLSKRRTKRFGNLASKIRQKPLFKLGLSLTTLLLVYR
jgi:hypothetical protein